MRRAAALSDSHRRRALDCMNGAASLGRHGGGMGAEMDRRELFGTGGVERQWLGALQIPAGFPRPKRQRVLP